MINISVMLQFKQYPYSSPIWVEENPVTELLVKVLEMRRYTLRNNLGRCTADMHVKTGKLICLFGSIPKRTETGWARFFFAQKDLIVDLLPGKSCSSHNSIMKMFEHAEQWAKREIALAARCGTLFNS